MTGILDSLAAKLSTRKRTAEEEYFRLCRQIAEGKEPSADVLQRALTDNGRTIEDVRAFVDIYGRRKAIHERLAKLPTLEKERAGLAATCNAADRALDEATRKHGEAIAEPVGRLAEIAAYVQGCDGLDADLIATCPYENMQARRKELWAATAELEREKFLIVTKTPAASHVRIAAEADGRPVITAEPMDSADARRAAREAAEAKSRLAEIESELAAAKAELATLESEMKRL